MKIKTYIKKITKTLEKDSTKNKTENLIKKNGGKKDIKSPCPKWR
jgi:hypothetical protein